MELQSLKGLGKVRLESLHQAGIDTIAQLLETLPRGYRDTTVITPIAQLQPNTAACVRGYLTKVPTLVYLHGKAYIRTVLRDASGTVPLVWFNQPWLRDTLNQQEELLLYGKPALDKAGHLTLYNPSIETRQALLPQYAPIAGIPPRVWSRLIDQVLAQLDACCPETLPDTLRLRYQLCERNYAIRQLHRPDDPACLAMAQRRVAFEELLLYQAALASLRGQPGKAEPISCGMGEDYWKSLPFSPTAAQKHVCDEICSDLQRNVAMRRMVQGDVGCGKTAVAFAAMYCCAMSGFQSALMAPTEILARQHFESAQKTLAPLGVRCGLLLGGMRAAERRAALSAIANGEWQCIIGTHALLSEGVAYQHLALAITDEQHRFGVRQRKMLSEKGTGEAEPHVLVMSATPIPRSLALILYGDLDISAIDELPPGRTPVRTRIVPESKRAGLYRFICDEAAKGRQCYIVCPLVEENEELPIQSVQETYAELANGPLSSLRFGLTYGAQPSDEKERMLADFAAGKIDVLISTTVIEVGVNVPSATVMVIENADRFGLAQLHQLRGRVGRGAQESWCFLLSEPNDRLTTLCQTNDGFEIARKDLELRGPGEFLGTAQHGTGALTMLSADGRLLAQAQQCMHEMQNDPAYQAEYRQVLLQAQRHFAGRLPQIALN